MSPAVPRGLPAMLAARDVTLVVALALCLAVGIMLLARYVPFLPLVTAYLLAGVAIGPNVLNVISHGHVAQLNPIRDIALAVILFTIGTRFEIEVFRRLWRWLMAWGLRDAAAMGLTVGLATFLLTGEGRLAVLTTVIAMEIAPAATFLVLRETSSTGPVTTLILNAVVVNNLVVVALFSLIYGSLGGSAHGGWAGGVFGGLLTIVGSVTIGLGVGLAISYVEQKYESDAERLLLLLGGILLAPGLCRLLGLEPFLISSYVAGIVLGNSSAKRELVRRLIERIDAPFYALFFILVGASLHVDYLLSGRTAVLTGAYILLRCAGRVTGGWLASRGRAVEPRVARWLPLGILNHSAVAVALVSMLTARPDGTDRFEHLQVVILAAVAVHELVAPILLKVALIRTGEVSVAHRLHRGEGLADIGAWRQVAQRLGEAMGVLRRRRPERLAQASLEQLILRDVRAIHADCPYPKVLGFVGHSNFDCFPVVDDEGFYVGYISYYHIRDIAFDPALGELVVARDMMVSGSEIRLDRDSPQDMAGRFSRVNTAYLPVVRPPAGHPDRLVLVGLLQGRALMRFLLAHGPGGEPAAAAQPDSRRAEDPGGTRSS